MEKYIGGGEKVRAEAGRHGENVEKYRGGLRWWRKGKSRSRKWRMWRKKVVEVRAEAGRHGENVEKYRGGGEKVKGRSRKKWGECGEI